MFKYFIADTHFHHGNIIKLCNRPFDTIYDNDKTIINNINERVYVDDELYILGDIGFFKDISELMSILNKINCENIYVILGNHDNKEWLIQLKKKKYIKDVRESKFVQKGNNTLFCSHFPMREWPKYYRGVKHVHGHCHGTLESYRNAIDVGVDCSYSNFYPLEFDEIIEIINSQKEGEPDSLDTVISKEFAGLNTKYFVNFCLNNKEIYNKIMYELKKENIYEQ